MSELGWAVDIAEKYETPWRSGLFNGRVLLISGGGTGIGFGICQGFGRLGCKIVMCGRRQEVLNEACEKLKSEGIEAIGISNDVRNPEACISLAEKAVEKYGKIDFLINNAAGNFSTPIENLSPNGFKTIMDIDLHGSFNMCKAVLPHMKNNGGGVITSISATLYYTAFPFQMAASAAKSAIDVMTNNIACEWGDYGIRCVCVAPGPINGTVGGPSGRVFGQMMSKSGASEAKYQVPTGRFGEVSDIANSCIFLCSPAGSYVSATTLVVDAGHWHRVTMQYQRAKDFIAKQSQNERKTHKGGVKVKANL